MTEIESNTQSTPQRALDAYHSSSLKSIAPDEAVNRYLETRMSEVAESTLAGYERSLSVFTDFCEQSRIENLNNLSGRDVDDYRIYRRQESSDKVDTLSTKTMRDEMYLLRDFLDYLEDIEAVEQGLSGMVRIPELADGDGIKDRFISPDRVDSIISFLEDFNYASPEHVVWVVVCTTGRRPGGIYGLNLEHLYLDRDEPYIDFSHSEDLRLKNGIKSNTEVNIPTDVAEVLRDYIENVRIGAEDKNGQPLLTTSMGRLSRSTMRRYFYKYTRPCQIGKECPHDKDPDACDAANDINQASKCPSTEPPYSSRHGHITALLKAGCPINVVSRRCDVSREIIEKHYDERSSAEKRESRREVLDQVDNQTGIYS